MGLPTRLPTGSIVFTWDFFWGLSSPKGTPEGWIVIFIELLMGPHRTSQYASILPWNYFTIRCPMGLAASHPKGQGTPMGLPMG